MKRIHLTAMFFVTCLLSISSIAAGSGLCGADLAIGLQNDKVGLISAVMSINGSPARLLVDTGANMNTLDIAEAQKLNIPFESWAGGQNGGGIAKADLSFNGYQFGQQRFSVMDLSFINVPSKKFGGEPFTGQLGVGFFKEFKARIDVPAMVLCVSKPEKRSPQ